MLIPSTRSFAIKPESVVTIHLANSIESAVIQFYQPGTNLDPLILIKFIYLHQDGLRVLTSLIRTGKLQTQFSSLTSFVFINLPH